MSPACSDQLTPAAASDDATCMSVPPRDPALPRLLLLGESMTMGGTQTIFARRARWLRERGWNVTVAAQGGVLEAELADADIPFLEMDQLALMGDYAQAAEHWTSTVGALLKFVDEHDTSVVSAHPIVPALAARELARVRPLGVHLEFLSSHNHLVPAAPWADEVLRGAASYLSGPTLHEWQERIHLEHRHLHQLDLGIDAARFRQAPSRNLRDELGIPDAAFVATNISRHAPNKIAHVFGFVDALAELMPEQRSLHALFVGGGPAHAALAAAVAQAGLDPERVHWLDVQRDLVPVFAASDAVYSIGTVGMEAAAAGTPVITGPVRAVRLANHRELPRNAWAGGYFGEYDFVTCGAQGPGMRVSSIAERLRPLITDPTHRAMVRDRATRMIDTRCDLSATMPAWAARYRELHAGGARRTAVPIPRPWRRPREGAAPVAAAVDAMPRCDAAPGRAAGDRLRVALCVSHVPELVEAPWERWGTLVQPLAAHGIDAEVHVAPFDGLAGADVVVAVGAGSGCVRDGWRAITSSGNPVVLVGEWQDDRLARTAALPVAAASVRPAAERDALLRNLRLDAPCLPGGRSLQSTREERDGPEYRLRALASTVTAWIAACDDEFTQLERATGLLPPGYVVAPWLDGPLPEGDAARFRRRVDLDGEFVLCLGELRVEHNQALVAGALDLPVVMVGAPDMQYQPLVRSAGEGRVRFVAEHDPQTLADAFAAAAAVVNAALVDHEPWLLRRAAESDVPLVVPQSSQRDWLQARAALCDPLDADSIRAAVDAARRMGRRTDELRETPAGPEVYARSLARVVWRVATDAGHAAPTGLDAPLHDAQVLVTSGDAGELAEALEQLVRHGMRDELELVVDDTSPDGSVAALLAGVFGNVRLAHDGDGATARHRIDLGMPGGQAGLVAIAGRSAMPAPLPLEAGGIPAPPLGARTTRVERVERNFDPVAEPPRLSAIVPTRDRPDLLRRALASLAAQSDGPVEAVVVDDGSREPVSWVLGLPQPVTYVRHSASSSSAAARNSGLREACAPWIGYLDDDDEWLPNHACEHLAALAEGSARMSMSTSRQRLERRAPDGRFETVAEAVGIDAPTLALPLMYVHNLTPNLAIVHARSVVDDVGGFDEGMWNCEDWDLFLRMRHVTDVERLAATTCVQSIRERHDVGDSAGNKTMNRLHHWRAHMTVYRRFSDEVRLLPEVRAAQDQLMGVLVAEARLAQAALDAEAVVEPRAA